MLLNVMPLDVLGIAIPILLLAGPYYLLTRRGRKPMSKAMHVAFRVTLAILLVWGASLLWIVAGGDGWSRLALLPWIFGSIPAALVTMVLTWAIAVFNWPEDSPGTLRRRVALSVLGLATLAGSMYVYRDAMVYGPASSIQTEAADLHRLADSVWAKYDISVLTKIAYNSEAPADLLQRLAQHADYNVRITVCNNRRTPAQVLELLAEDRELYTRYCVAAHGNASPDLLTRFASDPDESLRYVVASNANTPVPILAQLGDDEKSPVRMQVAANKSTNAETLAKLWRDENEVTRAYVARHPNTPGSLRLQMVNDPSTEVRRALLGMPSDDLEMLALLARDPDERIRKSAQYKIQYVKKQREEKAKE